MDNWLFLSVFILLGSVVIWIHHTRVNSSKTLIPANKQAKSYHGISVHPCSHACGSVNKIKRKRFLSREAPTLPILGCGNPECTCTYTHYNDRRRLDEDRRFITGIHNNERRINRDRRQGSFS